MSYLSFSRYSEIAKSSFQRLLSLALYCMILALTFEENNDSILCQTSNKLVQSTKWERKSWFTETKSNLQATDLVGPSLEI